MMSPWALLALAYAFGAIPFGLLIAKWWVGIDVREHGSGNIGATNVIRVVGKPAGFLVFALDLLKGLWSPLVAQHLGYDTYWQVCAGMAAVLGHSFSPFLGFRGGKGIATSLGVLFGVAWKVGVTAFLLWAAVLGVSGYVSLGSIVAAAALAPLMLVFYPGDTARLVFGLVVGWFAIFKHRANIVRLRNGTENSFKKKKSHEE